MFNLKTFTFNFPDVSIHCVSENKNITKLRYFCIAYKNSLNPELFIKHIIKCGVLACFEESIPVYAPRAQKFNNLLKKSGALFDIDYLEEAMLLAEPHKLIEILGLEELYGEEHDVSPYLQECFPNLPPKYTIDSPNN